MRQQRWLWRKLRLDDKPEFDDHCPEIGQFFFINEVLKRYASIKLATNFVTLRILTET